MQNRDERAPYMVQYRDADGELLTGFTVRGEEELAEAFAQTADRPEITVTWRHWTGLARLSAEDSEDSNPWRTRDELPLGTAGTP